MLQPRLKRDSLLQEARTMRFRLPNRVHGNSNGEGTNLGFEEGQEGALRRTRHGIMLNKSWIFYLENGYEMNIGNLHRY
ncbi:unnamed protein product [Lathyrus oleraceus]